LTLALSAAGAAALLVVAGAVVVQANSNEVPVTALGNTSENTGEGAGAGQPPAVEATPDPTISTDTGQPVPNLDDEETKPAKKDKHTKEPVSQVPNPVADPPTAHPTTATKKPESTPTPTKTKKASTGLVDPGEESTPTPGNTTTAGPTAKPKTTPKTTPTLKPNPYTATGVCGSGYKVVDQHALGSSATIYLLYSSAAGKNCVVTMSKKVYPGKLSMNAILQVQGGGSGSNPGKFTAYAGPVRLAAVKKCVIWGGSWNTASWKSGWSHCT
jgi:hypothetical protein